ncbi:MAG: 16S rRNA (cytosine(1402)-N(4))-methyltransferase RsmH [Lautropia sp.]
MSAPAKPFSHRPVLGPEAIDALRVRSGGVYVDGTFGRGGHSRLLLAALGEGGRLIALDRDPQAVDAGRADPVLANDPRVEIVHARFSTLDGILNDRGIPTIDGLLLDLGVSSPQLDDPSRGFSFTGDGPLDMRMDPTQGMSARQWLRDASAGEIAEVLRNYGDERLAVPIAKAIVARRGQAGDAAFRTTGELAGLVAGVVRSRQGRAEMGKNPATRTYQAIRIHTNSEITELALILETALRRLASGARMALISFHSIEDRMVKQFIARHAGKSGERHPVTGAATAPVLLRAVARVLAGDDELAANPRARSAILRVAERTDHPLLPDPRGLAPSGGR